MNTPEKLVIDKAVADLQIPPKPELLVEIDELLCQTEPDITAIANLIAKDVATSASVLKIINSPLYNLKNNIVNIRQATLYMGINGLVTLVKGLLLKQSFLQQHCCLSLGRFWDTADEVARTAIKISQELQLNIPQDYLYVLGLFHDVGIPVIASTFSDYKQTLIDSNHTHTESIIDLENHYYGTNHANIGCIMAVSWNLPKQLCNVILRHHDQDFWLTQEDSEDAKLNAVFQLAETFVHKSRRGGDSEDWGLAQIYVLTTLKINEKALIDLRKLIMSAL